MDLNVRIYLHRNNKIFRSLAYREQSWRLEGLGCRGQGRRLGRKEGGGVYDGSGGFDDREMRNYDKQKQTESLNPVSLENVYKHTQRVSAHSRNLRRSKLNCDV